MSSGSIKASYSLGKVQSQGTRATSRAAASSAGSKGGTIEAVYAAGELTASTKGGVVGATSGSPTITNSYWDSTVTGITTGSNGTAKTSTELKNPTGYTGDYANWNLDLDGDSTNDDPWDFGTATNTPPSNTSP